MLKREQRMSVLELHAKGVSQRQIARLLKVSRGSVMKVIQSQASTVPQIERAEKADPYRQDIEQLLKDCSGNLVRVHEELSKEGAALSYSTLTAFCRREGIGQEPKIPEGRYHFGPGQEQQHDTSPHKVTLSGVEHVAQTASLVLCFSRRLFFQLYPAFQRFDCKVFLTDALDYMGGSCATTMIDNTHVIIASGAGKNMIPAPEMAAFAERYGFEFAAHAVGNPDRKGRVEAPFRFIEKNFLPGRTFKDWADLNVQAKDWCDKVNATYKKHIRAIPMELYAQERPYLKPRPLWVPEVYRLHQRFVDLAGYISLHTNRYSVPADWISRQVEVRETKDHVHIEEGLRKCVTHRRLIGVLGQRSTLKEHFHPRPRGGPGVLGPEETAIAKALPEAAAYVDALKKRGNKQITLALRQLLRMVREYPKDAVTAALAEALHYGLYDLARVERMVLRLVAHDYFPIDTKGNENHD
jgi:transposase